jgi:hypothetical protein
MTSVIIKTTGGMMEYWDTAFFCISCVQLMKTFGYGQAFGEIFSEPGSIPNDWEYYSNE